MIYYSLLSLLVIIMQDRIFIRIYKNLWIQTFEFLIYFNSIVFIVIFKRVNLINNKFWSLIELKKVYA